MLVTTEDIGAATLPPGRCRTPERLDVQSGMLEALHEVAVAVASMHNPAAVARLVVDQAHRLLGVDEARLYWSNPEDHHLFPLADSSPNSALERSPEVQGTGILQMTFQRRAPVVVEDYPNWEHASDLGIARGVRSAAGVPLLVGDRAVGALMVRSYTPRRFDAQQVQLLALFAAQVAPALEATRLYEQAEQRRAEAEALATLLREGATDLDAQRVVNLVAERACLLVGADYGVLALKGDYDDLTWHGLWGSQPTVASTAARPSSRGTATQALKTGRTIVVEHLGENPDFPLDELPFHKAEGGRTVLATPLRSPRDTLGALILGWRSTVHLTADQIRFAEALASHAATIIDNARTHAEVAARAEELRMRYEAVACGILVHNPSGQITHANRAAEEMFGVSVRDMLGKTASSLWRAVGEDGADLPQDQRPALKALETGAPVRKATVGIYRPDGELRWHQVDAVPVLRADGQPLHVVSSFIDITERKRAEQEVKSLNAELEQRVVERTRELTAANGELEAFSYSVSHDLRSPLRTIDGFSQALIEDCSDRLDETGTHYLERVRTATQRMGQLIDDMLALSRVTRHEIRRERVNLSQIARSIADQLRQLEPSRDVTFVIRDAITAQGDPHLMRVVLENLLGNAWKFTAKRAHASIEFGATKRDGHTVFFVRDDGAGFDMAYAHKLFGAFQRLHRPQEFEGTGVGLASVQRIVRRHGGDVWAEGAVEQGATFYFTVRGERRKHA